MMNRAKAILELGLHFIAARLTVQQEADKVRECQQRQELEARQLKRRKVQKRRRDLTDRVMERLREQEEEG